MSLRYSSSSSHFLRLATRALPWLAGVTAVAFAVGLARAFMHPTISNKAPPCSSCPARSVRLVDHTDLGRNEPCRHRDASLAASAGRHRGKNRGAARRRLHISMPGHRFALERPMLGTYWVWDARQTSVLVLFLMYLGLIALTGPRSISHASRGWRRS